MGKGQALIRSILAGRGDTLTPAIAKSLFNHQKPFTMAINFKEISEMPDIPELLKNQDFKDQYVGIYNLAHNSKNGKAHYDRETNFVKSMCLDKPEIMKATPLSMAMALMRLARCGLSIDPIPKALAYLYPRDGGNRVVLVISAYGELALRILGGSISTINGPTLVYKGDDIRVNNKTGVDHTMAFQSDEIIGGFVTINRPDNTSEDKYYTMAQLLSYKKKGSGGGHSWTGGVDGQPTKGMLEAKILRHAVDTYPLTDLRKAGPKGGFDPLAADTALANAFEEMSGGDEEIMKTMHEPPNTDDDGPDYTEQEQEQTPEPTKPKSTKSAPPKEQSVYQPLDF